MLSKKKRPLESAPAVDGSRFLFLGGLHRSGTSILHDLLRHHPETSGISDSGAPHDEGQHLQTVFETAMEFGGPGRFAFSDQAHLTETDERVSDANRDRLLREWGPWFDLEKPVLLEKSPPNLIRSRFMQALFPGSRFAFIVRHPIAVSLATIKWSKNSVPDLLEHWLEAHRILLNDITHLEHKIVFRYEDFVRDPDYFMQRVCQQSGIEGTTAREEVMDHNRGYFDSWVRQVGDVDELLANVEPEVLEFADTLGYSFAEPFVHEPTIKALTKIDQA